MSTAAKVLRFLFAYWKLNLQGAMEFRASFFTQILSMMLNNSVWIVFWGIFFQRFPVIQGWTFTDVLMLWGIVAGAYGWLHILFGNISRVAYLIAHGQLDAYLIMPKNVLLHLLVSRMSFSAWGDVLFAWILFVLAAPFSWKTFGLYGLAQLLGGLLMGAVFLLAHSLSFWIGNAEGFASQVSNAMIAFNTYPIDIFHGFTRLLLFLILPAGFISAMPVALLKNLDWGFLGLATLATLLFTVLSVWVFYQGLKRYESGNIMTLKM